MLSRIAILLCIVLLVYNCDSAFSQIYQFELINDETGLPQNEITAVIQDKNGYLWFGTEHSGVVKYDGISFYRLNISDDPNTNKINTILEDKNGSIWLGTEGGIYKSDGIKASIPSALDTLSNTSILSILEDVQGDLWIGTYEKGLFRYSGENIKVFNTSNGLSNDVVTSSFEDSNGNLWFGTYWGINKIDQKSVKNGKIEISSFHDDDGLNNNLISAISEDKSGNVWIGTFEGISIYDGTTFSNLTNINNLHNQIINDLLLDQNDNFWISCRDTGIYKLSLSKDNPFSNITASQFTHLNEAKGLVNNNIKNIFQDTEHNFWFISDNGVNKYNGQIFTVYSEKQGLKSNKVLSILEDDNNRLWIGSYGGGLSMFNGTEFINYSESDGLASNKVYCLTKDSKASIWIGTANGVSRFNGKSFINLNTKIGLANNIVWSVQEDSKGHIWFGTMNGISKFNPVTNKFINYSVANGLVHKQVSCILEDSKGIMWFGTMGGLSKFDGIDFTNITVDQGLPSNYVGAIQEDKSANIWVGTYNKGVAKIVSGAKNKSLANIKIINSKNGLKGDEVLLMRFDNQGNLWTGNKQGLNKIDIMTYNITGEIKIKHYGAEKGLFAIKCNQNASWKDQKGNLWFGTENGIFKYNPQEDFTNDIETKLNITRYRLMRNDTLLPQNVRLSYDQNHLTFDYVGICLTNPHKTKYQYILKGFDKKWSPITNERTAVYSNLPPGQYTFKVTSCNNEGVWNKNPTSYTFQIIAPYWQTLWFYSLCTFITILLIYLFIKVRVKTLEREKRILEEKVDERTKELKDEKVKVEQIAEKLKSSNDELKSFASVVSHDLQAPLRKIRMMLHKVIKENKNELKERTIEQLDDVDGSSDRMQKLIKGLLSYSRLSTKAAPFESTDLNKIIEEVLSDLEISIKEVNGTVNVDKLPNIQADKLQMRQLFQNLISNAVKFHKANVAPVVNIKCHKNGSNFWEIKVEDNGVGFDNKYSEKLFKPFQRLHSDKEFEGTGIGMSICEKIVLKHKGAIKAESVLGEGSTFIINLPV